jgi:hypothetical protein
MIALAPRKGKDGKSEYSASDNAMSLPFSEEGRRKAIEATLDDLTKRFGEGTVVRLGDATHMQVDVIAHHRHCRWRRWYPARARHRNLRS